MTMVVPPGNAPGIRAPGPAAWAALAAVALCAAASFWITGGIAPWENDRANLWHHYEYLADGFLGGHTSLSLAPAPELARLPDPYDPAANAAYRLWDASLYHGKYYLYYGPTPAVALMAPWRALTGRVLPQRDAVALFACAGLGFLALLLGAVRRRHFPTLGPFGLAAVIVVAFHVSWLPVTLRRPGVWELPFAAAEACLWAAIYFLWKFHDSGGRVRWAAATGVALGLLMGSRVTEVFAAGLLLLLLFVPVTAAGPGGRRGPVLAGVLATAAGLALLAYNHERFGRWLEFGQSYQLWGMDQRAVKLFDASYFLYNVRLYLTSIPTLSPYFPFLRGSWPAPPAGYIDTEEIQGILFVLPVHLAGLLAVAWAWRNELPAPRALRITLLGAAGSSAAAGTVLCFWAGACSRYMTEFLGGWTVVTAVGLLVAFSRGTRVPRPLRVLAAAAAVWSISGVWLSSAEFRGFMRQTEPRVYSAAAHALNTPGWWWSRARGTGAPGPVDLDLRVPQMPRAPTVLLASGRPQMMNQLVLVPVDPAHVMLVLSENQHVTLETGPLALDHGRLKVRLVAPWLFPPAAHPFWDALADPAARRELQTRYEVISGAATAETHAEALFDAAAFAPAVLTREIAEPGTPYVAAVRPVAAPGTLPSPSFP